MNINIVHYHLFVGGVTTVIHNTLIALKNTHPVLSVNIFCGSDTNVNNFSDTLAADGFSSHVTHANGKKEHSCSHNTPHTVSIIINNTLFYHHDNKKSFAKQKNKIHAFFISQQPSEKCVWWVHNYHLGKNCAFTAALLLYIRSAPRQTFLLHIHDFPEQGRIENYTQLRAHISCSLYPQENNVRYIVINPMDYDILRDAGINRHQVSYIPNPTFVKSEHELSHAYKIPISRMRAIREMFACNTITKYAYGYPIPPQSRILMYPVRTIKRKNVIEAMLITALLNCFQIDNGYSATHPYAALIVTLPANSKQHYQYSRMIQKLFSKKAIGLWGIGLALNNLHITYHELIASSHAIISSSVQEGFGFTMFEALLSQKPFISRTIPTLQLSAPYFDNNQLQQYDTIRCPWHLPILSKNKNILYKHYLSQKNRISLSYSQATVQRVHKEIEHMFAQPYIDFSCLTCALQKNILLSTNINIFKSMLEENAVLLNAISTSLQMNFQQPNYQKLIATYGSAYFVKQIHAVLANNTVTEQKSAARDAIDDTVAAKHYDIGQLRPLLTA